MLTGKTAPVSNVPRRPQKRERTPKAKTAGEAKDEATETDAADPPAPPRLPGGALLREAWDDEKRPPAASQAARKYRQARGAVSTSR